MKITFETQKEVVVVKEVKLILNEINIQEVKDIPSQKRVEAYTRELGIITLWEGETYDAIGQWTDDDVINKIKSL